MSLFRPARKLVGPDGIEWEVYVSRYEPPRWRSNDHYDGFVLARPYAAIETESPLAYLWNQMLRPLLLLPIELARVAAKGSRSRVVRIEAITYYPRRESLLWTTTTDHAERVLRQISAGLEAGDVVRPLGGVFVGRGG